MEGERKKSDTEKSSDAEMEELSDEAKQLLVTTSQNLTQVEDEIVQENESIEHAINEAFKKSGGLVGVANMIRAKLNNWEEEEINIAVTGRTGVGKSCFINAIRGDIDESQPTYAEVGHIEGRPERKSFPHPANKRLIFWDLPGVGTETFPRKTYLKRKDINFHSYDVFIIMACDRFTEDEKWLATEVKKMGKIFLFVRSKIDNQIESDKLMKKKAKKVSNPLEVIDKIRKDCKKNLGDEFKDIYLINSLNLMQENLDFSKLIDRLVEGFEGLKAEALICSLGFLTPAILQKKFKWLKRRIYGMGALSSLSGAIPVPGTTLLADALLIVNETRLYRKQLGLSDSDLEALAELMNMPVDELAEKYSLKTLSLPLTVKGTIASSVLLASDVVTSAFGLAIPFVGMSVGAVLSFATTIKLLRSILDVMEKDAYIVLSLIIEQTGGRVLQLTEKSE
ncbi:T-cell-specific guanine nucleotide triphosphate-binding protein 2-like [Mercenaria mercenaria]|uniref:T-cell-specific guanine nucleotide triphosphate-binding protein 2-like n=1 Tax=Mercenaria mercenaria TaxID=6596 RepID=UPI00234EB030|nr:T-cell-specific guanine nucleotide triphosphate-binding protein 2-like [Mercenaria mercenaria]